MLVRTTLKWLTFVTFYVTTTKMKLFYGWFMGCSFFKFRLTITHMYSCFRVQALHMHTLTLESNYTAHPSDQNSPSTGSELHTALTTLKTVLSLSIDVILAKWSAITFASWEQLHWRGSARSSCPPDCQADARLASEQWRPSLVHTRRSPRSWRPLGTSRQRAPCHTLP